MPVKPCIGYPTRTAAVIALREKGFSTDAIAARTGIDRKAVLDLEISYVRQKTRAQSTRASHPSEENGRTVVLSVDILDALRPHAERRAIHVNELVRQIVAAVADDDMVDAVLDDADEMEGWA